MELGVHRKVDRIFSSISSQENRCADFYRELVCELDCVDVM